MKKLISLGLSQLMVFGFVVKSFAQTIPVTAPSAVSDKSLGNITSWQTLIYFLLNLFVWLGWAGVFLGVGFILFALIYKLLNADNEEAMKTVQGYITKAILIVIAGLLLLSLGFIIQFVANFLGITAPSNIGTDPGSI